MYLAGCAAVHPARVVAGEALGMSADSGEVSGFARVRVASDRRETISLLSGAARLALADAGREIDEIDQILAVRNGFLPELEAGWISLLLARELGVRDDRCRCLDLKAPACAGAILALDLAGPLLHRHRRILVVGGGAPGYRNRWIADPPAGPAAPRGVLVGDGGYAVVVDREHGRFQVLSVEISLDPTMADSQELDGCDYVIRRAQLDDWMHRRSPTGVARVLAASRAHLAAERPRFLVGSNSGLDFKTRLCRSFAAGPMEARFQDALDAQLGTMREFGHLFGGDFTANLATLQEVNTLRSGDEIVGLEAGDTYLYSAAVLRAA